ncbi:retrovirus-related pol polyprotein from transposon TNT 1-94 [Tanacetum coccineum]
MLESFLGFTSYNEEGKVTVIENQKFDTSLALDELIDNLKVHKVVMEKYFEIYRGKKERVKSIALKAKKESSDDGTSTSGSDDEEYVIAARNFKKFFRRKGKFVRQPREEKKSFQQQDQKAFIGGSWSDNENDAEDKTNDETCLMAQSLNKVCLRTCLEPDEWIKDSGCSKHMTGNKSLFSTYKAYDGGVTDIQTDLDGVFRLSDTAYLSSDTCMTRSSTKELLSPFENPEQKFRSRRRLFDTPSLVESNSPEFDHNFDIEKQSKEEEVILFYNGLDVPTRQILDSKGAIPSKTAVDAKIAIQEMAEYSQKWHNGTSSRTRSTKTSDMLAAIQAQLNNLGLEIKKVSEKVYPAQVGCELCKGPHYTKDCPQKEEGKTLEEAYYTQFGAPYQPGGQYRAAGPGFYQQNNGNSSYAMSDVVICRFGHAESGAYFLKHVLSQDDCKTALMTIGERAQDVKILDAYDHTLPQKEKDLGSFTLPCFIHNICFDKALVDLGASVSVMPFSTYTNLGLGILSHTRLLSTS